MYLYIHIFFVIYIYIYIFICLPYGCIRGSNFKLKTCWSFLCQNMYEVNYRVKGKKAGGQNFQNSLCT